MLHFLCEFLSSEVHAFNSHFLHEYAHTQYAHTQYAFCVCDLHMFKAELAYLWTAEMTKIFQTGLALHFRICSTDLDWISVSQWHLKMRLEVLFCTDTKNHVSLCNEECLSGHEDIFGRIVGFLWETLRARPFRLCMIITSIELHPFMPVLLTLNHAEVTWVLKWQKYMHLACIVWLLTWTPSFCGYLRDIFEIFVKRR